jgi:hypothetical protein
MKSLQAKVHRLLRMSWRHRLRILEAFACLGLARVVVLSVPFRFVARAVGRATAAVHGADDRDTRSGPRAVAVGQLVERVSRHTPWRSNCLAQALAATFMLRRRGLASSMYFGLAKSDAGRLEAHAWTRSSGVIVTGGRALERYTVVAVVTDGAVTDGGRHVLRSLRDSQ